MKKIVAVTMHPDKEKFIGDATKQDKSYSLMADHRIFVHTKSIEAMVLEYDDIEILTYRNPNQVEMEF